MFKNIIHTFNQYQGYCLYQKFWIAISDAFSFFEKSEWE